MRKLLFSTAILAVAVAGSASAAPITVSPGPLTASGPVTAVFAFADAGDTSHLLNINFFGTIFSNAAIGGDAIGTTKTINSPPGTIQFQLQNQTQGYSFFNDVADTGAGGDGFFHAQYASSAGALGVTLGVAATNAISLLVGPVVYVGFEDRRGGDYDYNDLIFAFSSVQVAVPEPASIALLGFSLLGAGMMRRSRPS